MPTIPTLTGPTVRQSPEPSRLPALESYGVDQRGAQAVARGLGEVGAAIERETERLDEIRVNEAEVQYQQEVARLWTDPNEGLSQQRGTKAVQGLDGFRDRLQTTLSEVESKLGTDRQKVLFRARADRLRRDADVRAMDHVGDETKRVDQQSHEALMAADREELVALSRAGDTSGANATVARMTDRVTLYGDRNGVAPEAIKEARALAVSEARAIQIDALLRAGNVPAAEEMYAAHRGSLKAKEQAAIREDLETAKVTQAAQQAAARALQGAESRADIEASLNTVTDPAVRSLARKITDAEVKRIEDARKADQEALYERWAPVVEQAGATAVLESIVPAPDLNRMTADQRHSLRVRGNAPAENDAGRWMEFYLMAPEARAQLSPVEFQTKYWSRFDSAHRSDAESMYQAARGVKGSGASGGGSIGTLTDQQRVRGVLIGMHLVSSPSASDWSKADEQVAAAFADEYDRRVRQWYADKKSITDDDRARIAGDIGVEFATFVEQGTGRAVRGADMVGRLPGVNRQNLVQPFDKIPLNRRLAIERAIRDNGLQPARDRVERAYSAELRGDTALYDRAVGKRAAPVQVNPGLMDLVNANRFDR